MKIHHATTALGALSQESRLALFRTLVQVGPTGLSAEMLAAAADTPSAALTLHLAPLLAAKLVSRRRHGRHVIYTACYEQINALIVHLMGA
jgi:DNA-binding transcriptional ArsR family regulator